MPPRASTSRPAVSRSAFTLLELLLVLTLLVLIGSIAAPRLTTFFERQQLNGSANKLRLEWSRARLEAMQTGQAQVFTCDIGQGTYRIRPLVLQSDLSNAAAGATLATGTGLVEAQQGGLVTAADAEETQGSLELEEDITFVSCLVASDLRAFNMAEDAQTSFSGEMTTQTVGQTVVFYPDGSTSSAEVQIRSKRGDVRAVQMRGITGHCRVVEVSNVAWQENDGSSQ